MNWATVRPTSAWLDCRLNLSRSMRGRPTRVGWATSGRDGGLHLFVAGPHLLDDQPALVHVVPGHASIVGVGVGGDVGVVAASGLDGAEEEGVGPVQIRLRTRLAPVALVEQGAVARLADPHLGLCGVQVEHLGEWAGAGQVLGVFEAAGAGTGAGGSSAGTGITPIGGTPTGVTARRRAAGLDR